MRRDVLAGMRASPRSIPSKYLYDAEGSTLFERITELDAYYPTRTEGTILQANGADIARAAGPVSVVLEYGSGSAIKTRLLLGALSGVEAYVAIDIAAEAVTEGTGAIAAEYPGLTAIPIVADYTQPFHLPDLPAGRRLAFFPGSTIGNFEQSEAGAFMRRVAEAVGSGGRFLLGVDLDKDADVLLRAYDDPEGVTAAFNRNLLARINREVGADFHPAAYRHFVRYDADRRRIEMYLVAESDQAVTIDGERFEIEAGEAIHTENAHKYRIEDLDSLAAPAGMRLLESWTDARGWFAVALFEVS
jgi:dimethylhistidine N-methyltransferase